MKLYGSFYTVLIQRRLVLSRAIKLKLDNVFLASKTTKKIYAKVLNKRKSMCFCCQSFYVLNVDWSRYINTKINDTIRLDI